MTRLLIAIAIDCPSIDDLAEVEAAYAMVSRAISETAGLRIVFDARTIPVEDRREANVVEMLEEAGT